MSPPLFVILVSLLAAVHSSSAATNEYLDQHNQARSDVGVPSLTWSDDLATRATNLVRYQRIKSRCQFANLTGGAIGSKYGGNQLRAGGMDVTPRAAVQNWVAQKEFYDHVHNTCVPDHPTCGVYTQVVWGKTAELGCAQATCAKEGSSLTVCLYYPPGNVVGETPY